MLDQFLKLTSKCKETQGQSTLEYALVLSVFVGITFAAGILLEHFKAGNFWLNAADSLGHMIHVGLNSTPADFLQF